MGGLNEYKISLMLIQVICLCISYIHMLEQFTLDSRSIIWKPCPCRCPGTCQKCWTTASYRPLGVYSYLLLSGEVQILFYTAEHLAILVFILILTWKLVDKWIPWVREGLQFVLTYAGWCCSHKRVLCSDLNGRKRKKKPNNNPLRENICLM